MSPDMPKQKNNHCFSTTFSIKSEFYKVSDAIKGFEITGSSIASYKCGIQHGWLELKEKGRNCH